jgi:hypothetical protein
MKDNYTVLTVKWHPEDVRSLDGCEHLSIDECSQFLAKYQDAIRQAMVSNGYEILGIVMADHKHSEVTA